MSSFLASYGRLGPGAFAVRIIAVIAVWAGLVFVMLHYVGKVWPHEYQIREAEEAQADENARNAAEKPAALVTGNTTAATATTGNVTTPAATSTAGTSGASTPAKTSAAASATAPAPAAAAAPAAATSAPAPGAAPAAATATPATASAAPATSAAPAAVTATGKPEVKEPPRDPRLDGYNRHAFFNVAIFYSIVISILSSGAALSQIIKRLRDLGWNGMLSILFLVPGVNVLFVLALMFTPGKPAPRPAH